MAVTIGNTLYSDTEAASLIKKLMYENEELLKDKTETLKTKQITTHNEPKLSRYNWDIVIDNIPYYAYCVTNYFRDGDNGLYICPRNEKPDKDNLIPYHLKSPVSWTITDNSHPYISCKSHSVYTVNDYIVNRNGKAFTHCYDLIDALKFIRDVPEHPMDLNFIDFDKKVVGRKIYWRSEPAIITSFNWGIGTVSFKPDGIEWFKTPPEFENDVVDYYEKELTSIHTDIFDKHICWFR